MNASWHRFPSVSRIQTFHRGSLDNFFFKGVMNASWHRLLPVYANEARLCHRGQSWCLHGVVHIVKKGFVEFSECGIDVQQILNAFGLCILSEYNYSGFSI